MTEQEKQTEAVKLRERRRRLQGEYRKLEQAKIPRNATERLHARQRQMQSLEAEIGRIDARLAQLAREETS